MTRTPTLLSQSGGRHRRNEDTRTRGGRSLGLRVTAVVSLAAKDAYHEAIDSGDADTASTAALGLGALLLLGGDVQGAKDAFQKAIDSGSADAAPMAAIGLGELLADEGDVQGAKDAFQKAIDSGRPDAALAATAGLGILADQGALSGSGAAGR
jgi:tetratricopeptide (TPR) repeat protein